MTNKANKNNIWTIQNWKYRHATLEWGWRRRLSVCLVLSGRGKDIDTFKKLLGKDKHNVNEQWPEQWKVNACF